MSPKEFFNNEDSLEQQTIVQDIRHNYGFVFSQITQLFSLYYPEQNKKLSKKAEDIETRIQILYKDKYISEYLYSNFFTLYEQYSTLLPNYLIKEKETAGKKNQFERLKKLKNLLMIYIGELSEEISDVIDKQMEYDKKQFFKEIYKY